MYVSFLSERVAMDRIIHDLANNSAHLNYTRFLDLISVDHERNPNQPQHVNWGGHAPNMDANNVGYELASPKPGPSGVGYASVAAHESLLAARSLALHDAPKNESSYKTLCFTELKAEMLPTANQPSTSRRLKSETNDRSTSSSKRVVCGICNMEMLEHNFEDHRYTEHIGLARPYGMSQEFSDSEKRRELKRALQLMKQVSCPYCFRVFTSTLGHQYHQSRCLAEVGDAPKPIECYLCGKQVAAYRAHMKIHRKEERSQLIKLLEETKVIHCHFCDSKYSTITGYMYHKDRCRYAPHPPVTPVKIHQAKRRM